MVLTGSIIDFAPEQITGTYVTEFDCLLAVFFSGLLATFPVFTGLSLCVQVLISSKESLCFLQTLRLVTSDHDQR